MAITAERSPYIMTAAGDDLASVFQGRDMLDSTAVVRFKVASIRIVFGASGTVILLQRNGGQIMFKSTAQNAGEEDETHFGRGVWFDGCYVQQIPANSEVYLYVV